MITVALGFVSVALVLLVGWIVWPGRTAGQPRCWVCKRRIAYGEQSVADAYSGQIAHLSCPLRRRGF